MAIEFAGGQLASLSMSCASYLGSGHRLEFYGEDGTLVLDNPERRLHARLPICSTASVRLRRSRPSRSKTRSTRNIRTAASRRCRGWPGGSSMRSKAAAAAQPDFAAGYRVQQLHRRGAARRTAGTGSTSRPPAGEELRGERSPYPGHRRQRLHRLRPGEGAVRAGTRVRVLDDNSRGAPRRLKEVADDIEFIAGDIRDADAVAARGARHGRGAPSRLRQRHRILLQRARARARRRRARHDQRDRRLPQPRRRHAGAGLELGGLSDAAAGADRRGRAAGRARSAQPALFLRRRQDHQRADGDQLRPQILRARADLPPAQRLRPGHGLRARHPAIRAAPAQAGGSSSRPAGCRSKSRAPARRPAASASSTIWSPASW